MSLLKKFWEVWKAFGHFIGNLLARIVLSIFYFSVFVPFGLGVKFFSDPLDIKAVTTPHWKSRTTGDQKLEDMLRQF